MTAERSGFTGRHVAGAGVAACALCCASPVLALVGIAGAGTAATLAAFAFAGLVFAVVVALGTAIAFVWRRSGSTRSAAGGHHRV